MKISKIKPNPNNPRLIKDDKFKKLVQSIKDFPAMMSLRPIVVNSEMTILGGNMRYKACQELGMKEIPDEWVKIATALTPEEEKRFIIEDNLEIGDWDLSILQTEWNIDDLEAWGLEIEKDEPHEIQEKTITSYKKTHILISFSPEIILDIQEYLDKILNIEGVEYEQSSN